MYENKSVPLSNIILPMRVLVVLELIDGFHSQISPIGSEVKPGSDGVVCKERFMYVARYLISNAASVIADL